MNYAAEVSQKKASLINRLDASRKATVAALATISPDHLIYLDAGWRVKDIIAHLAGWESEVVTSLNAYNSGGAYRIPDFRSDDEYNDQLFQKNKDITIDQIESQWRQHRAEFKASILAIRPEGFDTPILCPWGLTSDIVGIVNDMIGHEAEHLRDILKAAGVERSSPKVD